MSTDNVTTQVAEEFIHYLRSEARLKGKNASNGLMLNSVRNVWQQVKASLRRAEKQGFSVNHGFDEIEVPSEDSCSVYLTLDELDKVNKLKGLSKEAAAVRDRFLIGCYTAMRFSDYSQLNDSNIVGENIEIKTRKTGVKVLVPIHPVIKEIFVRNHGCFPLVPSQQSFGATIKRICRKAGIIEEVLYERTIGLKIVRKRVKKYELVSSHTARRTGATNMYLAGIPTFRIMLLTGHTTEQSFFKYIRIQREENARTLAEHPFFK